MTKVPARERGPASRRALRSIASVEDSGCDVIVALDEGKIVETGTHDELLAKNGYYHFLYTQQEAVRV